LLSIAISSVIIAILLIPGGLVSQTSAFHAGLDPQHHFADLTILETPNYVEDTIGDVKIRTIFTFGKLGTEVVDSFRVFEQVSGYERTTEGITFQLIGGVGADKPKLYLTTDKAFELQMIGRAGGLSDYFDFDIDVYLFTRGDEVAYRHLQYSSCDIDDYSITTLFDGDETYSGKTKFVIADVYTFTCSGYAPHCPTCLVALEAYKRGNPDVVSTLDLPDMPTWEDNPKFQYQDYQ